MKTFLVVEEQAGEGCDYTIGCGTRAYKVQAESLDALVERIQSLRALSEGEVYGRGAKKLSEEERQLRERSSDWTDRGERERDSVTIYEVGALYEVPLAEWRAAEDAAAAAAQVAEKERQERDTYEKLQKKYGAKQA